ncbi:hypothetical protein AOQ84DRAFT_389700 [Glonium stellatum]|uniref:DUF2428 domain-containing protein n=1 Tax=Glonium stellatum TaxID=574774 RepID=A0A8E2JRW7_9PEZI|nr:hypothetical protein AOQ84DRAFT_389700 [Glonium stellatum]
MSVPIISRTVPLDEGFLRALGKNVSNLVPGGDSFATISNEKVKELEGLIDYILETSALVNISATHRAAACNLLCAIIERCRLSANEGFRAIIWENNMWARLFNTFLERSDNSKAKSMRQVLVVLTGMLLTDAPPQSSGLRDDAVSRVLEMICRCQNRMKVKPALQALAHFITKDLVSIDQLVDLHRNYSEDGADSVQGLNTHQLLLHQFFAWVWHHDTAPAAGHLVTNFLAKSVQQRICMEEKTNLLPMWIEPLESSIRKYPESVEEFKHHIFPEVFRLGLDGYLQFLYHLRLDRHLGIRSTFHSPNSSLFTANSRLEITLLFAALQVGKELGLVKDVDYKDYKTIEVHGGALNVPDILFGRLLAHPLPAIRLAALSLLVSSTAVTRPITNGTFQCLRRHLPHLHADIDANFRGELLGLMQRLFDRLRASTATLSKALGSNRPSPKLICSQEVITARDNQMPSGEIHGMLQCHREFISWYLQFLFFELRPTSSYQRHISALKSLNFVLKSGLDSSIPHQNLSKQAQGDLKWTQQWEVFGSGLIRLLLDLLLDPFEDVRNAAVLNLKVNFERLSTDLTAVNTRDPTADMYSSLASRSTKFQYVELASIVQFIGRAETIMLRTGRADHADGVARAYEYIFLQCAVSLKSNREPQQTVEHWWSTRLGVVLHLIEQLEGTIAIASENLSSAVNGYPVHGIFASFRYIIDLPGFYPLLNTFSQEEIQLWRSIHRRIFACLESIWSCVREVLCNDAPEGHVPEDLEVELEINTKDILSYSWRALKEASALLRTVISKAPACAPWRDSILELSDFEVLGKLCFVQLAELRHRGAFSTVSQTFAACCARCIGVDDIAIQELPRFWYQDTLMCIRNKASMITRRSAGIPSLISGIMSAEPGGQLFEKAMEDLFLEASPDAESSNIQDSRLPQVHALNCLKEIFTTTRLGQSSEPYIGKGLDLAASKLRSKNWPIRNCGLMLFKALLDRLLGSSDTQKWKEQKPAKFSRLSYENYPNLIEIMARLLVPKDTRGRPVVETHTSTSTSVVRATEGVFPALQILQQAPPPEADRETVRRLVLDLTRSPHWHVRDMAARTFASGLRQTEHVSMIRGLISSLDENQNSFHGLLLCIKYSLQIYANSQGSTSVCWIMEDLLDISNDIFQKSTCPLAKATYLDLVNSVQKAIILRSTSSSKLTEIFDRIARQLDFEVHTQYEALHYSKDSSVTAPSALLRRSMSNYLAIHHILVCDAGRAGCEAPSSEIGSLQSILYKLGQADPDNCCTVLEELGKMLNHSSFEAVVIRNLEILTGIYRLSLTTKDFLVRSTAQSVLADLIGTDEVRCAFFARIDGDSAAQTLKILQAQCLYGSPSSMESAIRLQGFFLDHQLQLLQLWNQKALHDQYEYVRTLQKSLHESNSFSTRHAAMLSISGIRYIWMNEEPALIPPPLLSLSLVVYDVLNDDDDGIRELAAQTATRVIMGKRYRRGMRDAVPLLSSQRLAEYLARVYSDSLELCDHAMRRFMGCEHGAALFETSFQETLAHARKEDIALFVQEKQNLFIDGTREVVIWSRVLKRISSKAIHRTLVEDLTRWVMDGISLLAATAEVEADGPLGWTSKVEVFALGMRVIYGAEVLLNWGMRSRKVGVKGSEIRRKLREFADVAKSGIHELWIDRVEAVLAHSVLEKLALVKAKIEAVVSEV